MKVSKKLIPLAVASVLSVPAMMVAAPATAGASADITVANMYLWRGLSLSNPGPAISGSLSYAADSGFYGGAWTSSEGAAGSSETDLFLGFAGEVGGFGYDISYWEYLYPSAVNGTTGSGDLADTDASDFVLGVSYMGIGFTAYIGADSDLDDNSYYTLSYGIDKYSVTYGWWDLEFGTVAGTQDEYSHITFNYAATDELTFGVSIASSDLTEGDAAAVEEDPLFTVSYTKSFDL